MPQQDLAGALVTERSKELLNYTWLKYVAILGVLNDLRKTIPILSKVHTRDVGYMIDDVKKYHGELRKTADALGVTINRVKQLGDVARRHGLGKEGFASAVTEVQGIFGRSGNSAYDMARARKYELGAKFLGVDSKEFNALDSGKKAERYVELFAEYIAKLRAAGKMDDARKGLDAAQQYGFMSQSVRDAALEMSRSTKTPTLERYNKLLRNYRGTEYKNEAIEAASSAKSWEKFQLREQEAGGPLVSPEMKAKIGELKSAYDELGNSVALLKEKFTAIVVRANIDFFIKVLKAITWLADKMLVLANYADRLSRWFEILFKIPIVGAILKLTKWIALWFLFGKIVPRIITLVAMKMGLLIYGSDKAVLAFIHFGSYASRALMWIMSPLHSIIWGLKLLWRGILTATVAIGRLTIARVWQIMGAGVGFVTTGIRAMAAAAWAALPPILIMMGKFLLVLAIVWIIAEAINTLVWGIMRLFGATHKWSSMLEGAAKLIAFMADTLTFGMGNSKKELAGITAEIERMNREAGKPGNTLAASFRAISQQDLFGGMLDQIMNIPDRIMPSAMKLIKSQLKYAKNDLVASFLGVYKIENEVAVRINLRDETGHALGEFVAYGQ